MSSKGIIEHTGTIKSIANQTILVNVKPISACNGCRAKGICSVDDEDSKIIEIIGNNELFSVGEQVNVMMTESLGFKALFLGYLLPFIIVLLTLISVLSISDNQGLAGLFAIGILGPYYIMLYILKDNIRKRFSFSLRKI